MPTVTDKIVCSFKKFIAESVILVGLGLDQGPSGPIYDIWALALPILIWIVVKNIEIANKLLRMTLLIFDVINSFLQNILKLSI